ncbi:MAG: hypothetical protein HXX17_11895 [Geobacteraceae bacterium]|nr:hypothetical protein [Geobacteraceae bacterium]
MKLFALISVLAFIAALFLVCGMALAQICQASPTNYIRNIRPAGVTPNYPPASEPVCLYYTTPGVQP